MNNPFRHTKQITRLGWWLVAAAIIAAQSPHAKEPTDAKEAAAKKAAAERAVDEKFQQWKATLPPEQQAWETTLEQNLGSFYLPLYKQGRIRGVEQAWDYVKDDPKLPRALLIGDSISRGYTLAVRHVLAGKVNVHRAPENCGGTANGLKKLSIWLGDGRWDVIHFNFGIHDRKTPPADYEKRLEEIIAGLKATKAKLIWSSSTPLPPNGKGMDDCDIVARNEIAARLVQKHGVAVNDLYSAIKPHIAEYQNPKDCHFNGKGYDFLGRKVADEILVALNQRK